MKIKILIHLAGSVLIFITGCSQKSSSKEFDHGEYIIEKMNESPNLPHESFRPPVYRPIRPLSR